MLISVAACAFAVAATANPPSITDLRVVFEPSLAVDSERRGASVFLVDGGSTVRFDVLADLDDGSTRDVTDDPALEFGLLSPLLVLSGSGEIRFLQVTEPSPVALSVSFGGHVRLLSFVVQP